MLSGSATALQRCGPLSLTTTVARSSPSGTVDATIYTYSTVGSNNILTVSPTSVSHVGTWTFTFTYCLTNYPSVCGTSNTRVTIVNSCVISGTTPSPSSVTVFDVVGTYSAFTAFTATTGCGAISYSATEAPVGGVSALSTF